MQDGRVSEGLWQLSAASVLGKGHVDHNLPNQDAVAVSTNSLGDVVCGVVSDGAGTASRSAEGSRLTADFVAAGMCLVGKNYCDQPLTAEIVAKELAKRVLVVRRRLEESGESLREFHCTMVMWLMPLATRVARPCARGRQRRMLRSPALSA